LPLSAAQLGIWYAIKAGTSASAYSIAEYTRIFGSVDKGLFETALRQLISEVEVLRLRFFESDGAVRQSCRAGRMAAFVFGRYSGG